jgi:hypothetical protein
MQNAFRGFHVPSLGSKCPRVEIGGYIEIHANAVQPILTTFPTAADDAEGGPLMVLRSTAFGYASLRGAEGFKIIAEYVEAETGKDADALDRHDALYMMIDARMTCFQGQVVDALAIYETIVRRLPAD